MAKTWRVLHVTASGVALVLLSGCGGGSSGSSPSVTTYAVSAVAGSGGGISPAGSTVNAGGTTMFSVTSNSGYAISGVTGCGGTLSGNTYTTGTINARCTVTASLSAAFTWISGSTAVSAQGVYGTRGVAAATNLPRARYSAIRWTDASGNLWLFGGLGYDSTSTADELNDLWKYSPASGEWTWVGGSNIAGAMPNYGTRGVAVI
jgi:hypothetical protein